MSMSMYLFVYVYLCVHVSVFAEYIEVLSSSFSHAEEA